MFTVDESQTITSDFSQFVGSVENLALLSQGISQKCVVGMVKGLPSLQRAFKGFRPSHLPWNRVPQTLVHYASSDSKRTKLLVDHWMHTKANFALRQYVAEKLDVTDFRPSLVSALAEAGAEKREALLCALLLDDRLEVRESIADEVRCELLEETSELVLEAQVRWQELEREREIQRRLKNSEVQLTETRLQLDERAQQLQELQARFDELEQAGQQREDALSEAQRERQLACDQGDVWRAAAEEVESRERDIKVECQQLKSQNANLEAQLQNFIEAHKRLAELDASYMALENEKRQTENSYRHLKREHSKAQRALEDERKHPRQTVSLALLDESWREALSSVASHLRAHSVTDVTSSGAEDELASVTADERAGDWRHWQQHETRFARYLLEDSLDFEAAFPDELEACLSESGRAQQLLALRWYLIEGFRLRLLELLGAANVANGGGKTEGDAL